MNPTFQPGTHALSGEIPFCVIGETLVKGGSDDKGWDIDGIVSSESRDADGEIVLQKGLDWSYATTRGWFNDNHDSSAGGGVGIIKSVSLDRTPSGVLATRVRGILLPTDRGRSIAQLAKSANEHGRPMGFSVEGGIAKRAGPDGSIVARAFVRDVAITRHGKNPDVTLAVMCKGFGAGLGTLDKSATMFAGYGFPGGDGGSGAPMVPQSLDGVSSQAALSREQAVTYICGALGCDAEKAARIYDEIMSNRPEVM